MSVGNWTPEGDTEQPSIDQNFLRQCLQLAEGGRLEELPTAIDGDEQVRHQGMMRLPFSAWEPLLADYTSAELQCLIRFFTRAEMLLPGWEAGEHSPAIWANRVLKQRGERLDTEELRWIRAHTTNRFIPNGGL